MEEDPDFSSVCFTPNLLFWIRIDQISAIRSLLVGNLRFFQPVCRKETRGNLTTEELGRLETRRY